MELPIVEILLKDRVLQQVPFRGEQLRIGRMKENDLVINNLAVSRFHAVLHREGDAVELEDLGSENGCFVNGARVRGRVPLAAGDAVRIGKHTLRWTAGDDAAQTLAPAAHGPSDAWDAAQTYFAPAAGAGADADLPAAVGASSDASSSAPTGPPVDAGPAERPTDLELEGLAQRAAEAELDLAADGAELEIGGPESEIDPELEGLDLGEEAPALDAEPADGPSLDVAEEEVGAHAAETFDADAAPEPPASPDDLDPGDEALERALEAGSDAPEGDDEGSPFDFAGDGDLAASDPDGAPEQAASAGDDEASAADDRLVAGRYPGLILQRGGRLERVVAWEDARLAAALDADGLLRLGPDAAPACAVFAREGERFRVRAEEGDGLSVNGEPTAERVLEVGDVVAVGEWKLTFVLDHEPVQSEVLAAPGEGATQAGGEEAAGAPDAPAPGEAPTVEMQAPDASASAELDLLSEPEEDEEKELPVTAIASASRGARTVEVGPLPPLRIELELQPQDLPAPLRALVDALEDGEISVPVRLRLRAGR